MSGAVNFAGILACHSSINEIGNLLCGCLNLTTKSWIVDSEASNHMNFNKKLLKNIRSLPFPFLVTLPNGYRVKVTEIGDACLSSTPTLYKGPSLKSPLVIGRARNGLYFLCSKCHHGPCFSSPISAGSIFTPPDFLLLHVLYKQALYSPTSSVNLVILSNKKACSNNEISQCSVNHFNSVDSGSSYISHDSNVDHLWHNKLGHVPSQLHSHLNNLSPAQFAPWLGKQDCSFHPRP
ncbi:uncharacterized protein LOC107854920 [Capsicum annuum]|uniref:uncharacterized protein LOC107854920 n=1 Tax=Capsicum annuum TaxID=4072 RepID=UPI0007BEDF7A|nr:uncharacterized protein LOC107854920 [Capsicum annuum]